MTSNHLDTRLAIRVETEGKDKLEDLASAVDKLGKEAGDAAPEFGELGQSLRELSQQQALIDSFAALKRETVAYGEELKAAQALATSAARALREQQAAVASAAEAERQAAAALDMSRAKHDELKLAVSAAANELQFLQARAKESGTATSVYAQQVETAKARLAQLREASAAAGATTKALAADYRPTAAALKDTTAAATAAERAFGRNREEAARAKEVYEAKRLALHGTRQALQQAGIASTDLAGAQQKLARRAEETALQIAALRNRLATVGPAAEAAGRETAAGFAKVGPGIAAISEQLARVRAELLAFFAARLGVQMLADLGRTADLYANLGARLDLVNRGQAGFNLTLGETAELARRTHSALGGTTDLLAAIARAGAELKVSQQDVLRLTETINKANQVSGQSVAAADAAVVQFIQGLQSGVLRGEEFNSVMEQSPRLAKALADGLKVPVGALRQMAEEGQLTSDTIIRALQSQARAIDKEFAQLPLTIDRALTDLSTNWTLFLGELDKSTGASAAVAGSLKTVADNLDTIADLAAKGGKIVVAALAVQALGAVRAYIAEVTLATAATSGLAAASTALGAAWTRLAPLIRAAGWGAVAVEVLDLTRNLMALREEQAKHPKLMADVEAGAERLRQRYAQISAQTGVTVTSLAELDKAVEEGTIHFDEAAASWRAGAAPLKDLGIASVGLVAGAHTLVQKFREVSAESRDVNKAIKELVDRFDSDAQWRVQSFGQALADLQAAGKLSAEQVAAAWDEALSKLDGEQLQKLTTTAKAVFEGVEHGASALAAAMDASLRKSIAATGQDFQKLQTGIGADAAKAIGHLDTIIVGLDRLQAAGIDTGTALRGAIEFAANAAGSERAIEAVRQRIVQLGSDGKLTGDQVDGLLTRLRERADEISPGINSVSEALKALGVASDSNLKKVADDARKAYEAVRDMGGSVRETQQAFVAYAEKAIAASNGVASAALRAEAAAIGQAAAVRALEAAAQPLSARMQEIAKATSDQVTAAEQGTRATQQQAAAQVTAARTALELAKAKGEEATITRARLALAEAEVASAQEVAAAKAREVAAADEKVAAVQREAEADGQVTEAERELIAVAERLAEAKREEAAALREKVAAAEAELAKAKESAEEQKKFLSLAGQAAQEFEARAAGAGAAFERVSQSAVSHAGTIARWWEALGTAHRIVGEQLDSYEAALARATAAQARGTDGLRDYISATEAALSIARNLGLEDLDTLRNALADARRQMQALSDAARSTLDSVNDELDQLNGRYQEIERRRLAARRAEIEAQLGEAKAAGNGQAVQELQAALRKLEEIERIRLEEARIREREERERGKTRPDTSGGGATQGNGAAPVRETRSVVNHVNISIEGVLDVNDQLTLEKLGRRLRPVFRDMDRRGA